MNKRAILAIGFIMLFPISTMANDSITETLTTENEAGPSSSSPVAEMIEQFPKPQQNQQRHVILLSPATNEKDLKVELIIGKKMEVDCNHHTLTGTLKLMNLPDWGYEYWILDNVLAISTRMACFPADETHAEFVTVDNLSLLRYNSRIPIVVYTPKDLQVRYRIWQAGSNTYKASVK